MNGDDFGPKEQAQPKNLALQPAKNCHMRKQLGTGDIVPNQLSVGALRQHPPLDQEGTLSRVLSRLNPPGTVYGPFLHTYSGTSKNSNWDVPRSSA